MLIRRDWQAYSAFGVFAVMLLGATFARSLAGLKPGEVLLLLLASALIAYRLVRRDWQISITRVDAAFALFMVGGTVLPLLATVLRGIYVTAPMVHALAGPVEYYLWYRVFLEALPIPAYLPQFTRLVLIILTFISLIGILQVFRFPGIEASLLHYYPTYETFQSQLVLRATSLVGGWETLGALAVYALILINQLWLAEEEGTPLFGSQGKRWLILMVIVNTAGLVATLSIAGFIALGVGIIVAWRLQRRLSPAIAIIVVAALVAAVALAPFIMQRYAYQFGPSSTSVAHTAHSVLPQTWTTRAEHWKIVAMSVAASVPTTLFGVQPDFAYPVLAFGSTESLYLLVLYRGGLLYLALFLGAFVLILQALWRARQAAEGYAWHLLTAIFTIFIINAIIDIFDAHLFGAGEAQLLMILLAAAIAQPQRASALRVASVPRTGPSMLAYASSLMRPRLLVLSFSLIIATTLVTAGIAYIQDRHMRPPPATLHAVSFDVPTAITLENQHMGTSAWQIGPHAVTTFIQGYGGQASVLPGDSVALYISAQVPTTYALDVYRIGWYYGLGGRLLAHIDRLQSQAQGYWLAESGLHDCATCTIDPQTHLIDAHWTTSYMLATAAAWPSGVYLIKITATNGAQSYIPLVLRAPQHRAHILADLPINTYQAVNPWGGASLVAGDPAEALFPQHAVRATQVSFNRPYAGAAGSGDFLNWDIHTVRWLERVGYDVDYTTSIDVAADPAMLRHSAIYLAMGHDAYWTRTMREGIQAARAAGIDLAFFGAQDGYWQARLERDSLGHADRTLTCYEVATDATSPQQQLGTDPLFATHPELVTARWRDPALAAPENTLLGIMERDDAQTQDASHTAWVLAYQRHDPVQMAAGVKGGLVIKNGLIGARNDSVVANGATPNDLIVMARTGAGNDATTSYYRAASGAIVFDAGTLEWSWGLDEMTPPGADLRNTVQGNQAIVNLSISMLHLMDTSAHPLPAGVALPLLPSS